MIVYVSIGNSDDKLNQEDWALFQQALDHALRSRGHIHGAWYSLPNSPYQNACWCVEFVLPVVEPTKEFLTRMAYHYRQDSICWAEVPTTRFLGQEEDE